MAATTLTLLLSSACALALELVWLRQLRLAMDGAPLATAGSLATLLVVFGAGAALVGRLRAHPKRPHPRDGARG